ncbi:MAG: glycosyltransferase family 2 protein [Lachnospiraceae bacterium]|nr:glycosyltransferase family 2 protein [Lachnospiraceae bacterium]
MSKISIVVPVYYNADTLPALYEDLQKKILKSIGEYELVFVDDGSGDNSWEVMNQIREKDSHTVCVKLSRNFGEHAALLAGLSVCTGDCAVTKQADLQEDSAIIAEMYESWKRGNKVVLALREKREENPIYVFFANIYYSLIRQLVNKNMPRGGCDCYLIDRQVIEVLERLDEKNSSLTLQVLWAGFKTDHVYFVRQERETGKSRWTMGKRIKLIMDSVMSFSYFPLRFMTFLGVGFDLMAFLLMVSVFVEKFTKGTPVAGWPSLMCVVLLASGLIMSMLGILGEYIWRTLDAARSRPPFIIDQVQH